MPDGIKRFLVTVPKHIYFKFINRARFYDISSQEIFAELMIRFNNGEFDEVFSIPSEDGDVEIIPNKQ